MFDPATMARTARGLSRVGSHSSIGSSTSSHGGSFYPGPPTGLGVRPGSAVGLGERKKAWAADDDGIPDPSTFPNFDETPGGPNVPAPLYRQDEPSYTSVNSARSGAWGSEDMFGSGSLGSFMEEARDLGSPEHGGFGPDFKKQLADEAGGDDNLEAFGLFQPPTPQGSVDLTSRSRTAVGGPSSFLPGAQQVSSRPPSAAPVAPSLQKTTSQAAILEAMGISDVGGGGPSGGGARNDENSEGGGEWMYHEGVAGGVYSPSH